MPFQRRFLRREIREVKSRNYFRIGDQPDRIAVSAAYSPFLVLARIINCRNPPRRRLSIPTSPFLDDSVWKTSGARVCNENNRPAKGTADTDLGTYPGAAEKVVRSETGFHHGARSAGRSYVNYAWKGHDDNMRIQVKDDKLGIIQGTAGAGRATWTKHPF
jgi:hypothetical protein